MKCASPGFAAGWLFAALVAHAHDAAAQQAPPSPAAIIEQLGQAQPAAQPQPPAQAPMPTPAAPAQGEAQPASVGQSFATRHGVFEARSFDDLPGWKTDSLAEAAEGMRQSCVALQRKPVWASLCSQFQAVGHDPVALRSFFEGNFYVYQVMSTARQPTGKLTGYFEPLLDGSRQRDSSFRYPVYGQPNDLRLLDARAAGSGSAWLRQEGNRLKAAAPGAPGAREYEIALGDSAVGIRDKRYRVRVEGRRLLPYWSRQEIEQRAIDAPVLAWVDDAYKLYSMQVQGSGKIRLREGGIVRVAYAEQNGHPFRPRVTRGGDIDFSLTQIKARGLIAGSSSAASIASPARPAGATRVTAPVNVEVARIIAQLQGSGAPPPAAPLPAPKSTAAAPSPATRPQATGNQDGDVAAMVEALKGTGPAPPPRPVGETAGDAGTAVAASDTGLGGSTSAHAGGGTDIPDPSYVFFRGISDGPQGPIGALGVPLSAERSLAVDPRSTPLGAPVFISSSQPAGPGQMQKLMFAQDTGGAIRGSVRADFYWGFGDDAGRLALATNESMQMWLLLPMQQPISAVAASGMKLRGGASELPDCVVPDPDLCVED